MKALTVSQQYVRIIYLGISFMIMFTSYKSLQNIVSNIYQEYDYKNLGQTALLLIYGAFGVTVIFSSFIVKKLGYKKSMFFASLGYGIFEATGLLIVTEIDIPHWLIWIAVVLGAIICGVSASTIWVAQGAYTSQVADENRKAELFGLFWGLMMTSQIIGNILIIFVLGKMSNLTYFIILTILGFSSAVLFLFLPNVSKQGESQKEVNVSFKQQVDKIWKIVSDKKNLYLNIYFLLPGLVVSFYSGFLYKLIINSTQSLLEISIENRHRFNFLEGFVFIVLGICQLITGIIMNRIGQNFCKFKLAIVGTLLVQLAAFSSFISFFLRSYQSVVISAAFWGISQIFLQANNGRLVSKLFNSKLEAFSSYNIFTCIGAVLVFLLNIILSSSSYHIFIIVIVALQVLFTIASMNLKDLETDFSEEGQRSDGKKYNDLLIE